MDKDPFRPIDESVDEQKVSDYLDRWLGIPPLYPMCRCDIDKCGGIRDADLHLRRKKFRELIGEACGIPLVYFDNMGDDFYHYF